ncbi:GIY-YIG nuclease family protein [Streptomyces sp. NPDC005786]|uniref:GIY-YIG nuclease family protein n=1 Tax=Streptomyces sp. NPDC005786 TaxID=3154891 RepID=UPI0033D8C88B
MPPSRERTTLTALYTTSETTGLPPYLDRLYPQLLQGHLYMGTADSCLNGGPGIGYGLWDFDEIEVCRVVEWGAPLAPTPVAVYRLRDQRKRLLYVGVTDNLEHRWTGHAADKVWWADVATRSVEWHPTRTHALVAEAAAIRAEEPLYNIQHNGQRRTKAAH